MEREVEPDKARLAVLFQASHRFVEAEQESDVIDLILRLSSEITGSQSASFVPLDEWGQPLSAIRYGDIPKPLSDEWLEYLASPVVRERCRVCSQYETIVNSCPLLERPSTKDIGVYCLPLNRGEHKFGVLNLYIPENSRLNPDVQDFLHSMIDATALALEGVRLRNREKSTINKLQSIRNHSNLVDSLADMLRVVAETIDGDFAIFVLSEGDNRFTPEKTNLNDAVVFGQIPEQMSSLIISSVNRTISSQGDNHVLDGSDYEIEISEGFSLITVPISSPGKRPSGVMLFGRCSKDTFRDRQISLLQTVADQAARAIVATNQIAEMEYRIVMDERVRLAREIHDGLAQTLGFLKLQLAQMKGYYEQSEMDRLRNSIMTCYNILVNAYEDAREAIDGLRVNPYGERELTFLQLSDWLGQTVSEFEEANSTQTISVNLSDFDTKTEYPPEVHAQIIRIVQETLSNIRKHSQATEIWITCREDAGYLILEIRDNGRGFSPEDIPGPSRHGLRGMKERADLIGADFQIISCPRGGTTVQIRLPVDKREQMEQSQGESI
jgi:two-component system nitrate/nitrite sensor histidine kinase NarX